MRFPVDQQSARPARGSSRRATPTRSTPAVWSQNAARTASGVLQIAGVSAVELAERFGTPVYVVDEADVREPRTRHPRRPSTASSPGSASTAKVYYAGKAFLCTEVARWVTEAGLNIDVCSGGELAVALAAGSRPRAARLPRQQQVARRDRPRRRRRASARSSSTASIEIERVAEAAARHGVVQPVRLRVNSGVHAHTHEYLATAREDQKFGIALADAAAPWPPSARSRPSSSSGCTPTSARRSSGRTASPRRPPACSSCTPQLLAGGPIPELNLGGGFGIAYTSVDVALPIDEIAAGLADIVAGECARLGIPVPVVAVEPGRSIVGPSTSTLYTVGTIKDVLVDGKRHAQIRERRRRHERQRPPRAVRRRLLRADRQPRVRGGSRPRAHRRQALRERRHRRARRLPARRRAAGRPRRGCRDRRVLLVAGEQLQLPRPATGRRRARRAGARHRARRNRGRPAVARCGIPGTHRLASEAARKEPNDRVPQPPSRPARAADRSAPRWPRSSCSTATSSPTRAGAGLELVGVAVRDLDAARTADIPQELLTTDAESLILGADIVIELIGGIEPARTLHPAGAQLRRGRHHRQQGAARHPRARAVRRGGAGRRPALLRGGGGRRDPDHPPAARQPRRRPRPAHPRHRQRHHQLHPRPHGHRRARASRRRSPTATELGLRRERTRPPTSRASTPRRRRRSSRASPSTPPCRSNGVPRGHHGRHPRAGGCGPQGRLRGEAAAICERLTDAGRASRESPPASTPRSFPATTRSPRARRQERRVRRGRGRRRPHVLRRGRRGQARRRPPCSATSSPPRAATSPAARASRSRPTRTCPSCRFERHHPLPDHPQRGRRARGARRRSRRLFSDTACRSRPSRSRCATVSGRRSAHRYPCNRHPQGIRVCTRRHGGGLARLVVSSVVSVLRVEGL